MSGRGFQLGGKKGRGRTGRGRGQRTAKHEQHENEKRTLEDHWFCVGFPKQASNCRITREKGDNHIRMTCNHGEHVVTALENF